MIQYPSVFALMAPPTTAGVRALNLGKNRLPGKFYGSVIGRTELFFGMAAQAEFSQKMQGNASLMKSLESCFIRIRTHGPDTETAVVHQGTHQGLLFPEGDLRNLAMELENWAVDFPAEALFPGKKYRGALCTSANISGDPLGSIVDKERAVAFAESMNIPLLVYSREVAAESGSYPILFFDSGQVKVERKGPGLHKILSSLPADFSLLS